MLNLASNLSRNAFVFPDRPALIDKDGILSYSKLEQRVDQVANGLHRLDVGPGDRVGLICDNRAAFVIAYYAILRIGAIVVPINTMLKAQEFAYYFLDADMRAVICQEGTPACPSAANALPAWYSCERDAARFILVPEHNTDSIINVPDTGITVFDTLLTSRAPHLDNYATSEVDTAVILYTSGTTGYPKGAELSHSNLVLNAAYSALMQKADSQDRHLVALPLFHAFGQTLQMNAALTVGASLVLMQRFNALDAWALMDTHQVSLYAGVPTMYHALLDTYEQAADAAAVAAPASTWRLGMSGGASLPVAVIERFKEKTGLVLLEGYGLSESSPLAVFSFFDTPMRAGSVGYPLYGTEVRVAPLPASPDDNQGEIQLRGHHIMKGYYGKPEASDAVLANGWLSTGDIGRIDDDHALSIVDRAKDVVIRGGYNIYPREIEELFLLHPSVSQVAVIGIPDPYLGEEVAAVVVPRASDPVSEAALLAWSRQTIAAYKYPRNIKYVKELPRNATGKIMKHVLRNTWDAL